MNKITGVLLSTVVVFSNLTLGDITTFTKTQDKTNYTISDNELKFKENQKVLNPGDKRYAIDNLISSYHEKQFLWESSNPAIVSINQSGIIEAIQKGEATITVINQKDKTKTASFKIRVTDPSYDAAYKEMQNRWKKRIVGEHLNLNDKDIKNYVNKINIEGLSLWESLHKEKNRTTLWDPLPSDTVAADYTTQFTKLQKLTRAFAVEGTSLYQKKEVCDAIIEALKFMVHEKKYNGSYQTGNWWDWDIGAAHQVVDILMILSDYTDDEILKTAAESVKGYVNVPEKTGANLTDTAIGVLGSAIILKEEDRINAVRTAVPTTMNYVTTGDGIYQDGSIIQHKAYAYTGSYGNELVKGIGKIQNIISGTKFEITDPRISNIYDVIVDGYLPLMHKGQMMSMVNGRSVSRGPGSNNPFTSEFATGSETIANILLLVDSAPLEQKQKIQSSLKSWIKDSEGYYDFYETARDFSVLLGAKKIMEDTSIQPSSFIGMKVYGAMDRAVQVNPNYTVGLSMYSSRIYNYESINNENLKGWHQNDGTLFIYNHDLEQYGEGYYPTVDPYRLPGTTTDTKELSNAIASGKKSPQSFVGGTTNGKNGAIAMYYDSSNLDVGMNLKAKKSWFLLDGKIICLGAGINGTTDASIETTVENRMMTHPSNRISVNGTTFTKNTEDYNLKKGNYLHFQGTGTGNDIGYYFMKDENVNIKKETRVGTYQDINPMFPNGKTYTKTYFKAGIQHGKIAQNDTYEYMIIPGASEQEMKEYSKKPSLKVLYNNENVQAVMDHNKNTTIYAMNIWEDKPTTVYGITVNKAASIYMEDKGNELIIHISDPKQTNTTLNVKLETGYKSILEKDNSVTIEKDGSFTIDTSNSAGASHMIKVSKTDKAILQEFVDFVSKLNQNEYTNETWQSLLNALDYANAVLKQEIQTEEELKKAYLQLNQAYQNLKKKPNETINQDENHSIEPNINQNIDTGVIDFVPQYALICLLSVAMILYVFRKRKHNM